MIAEMTPKLPESWHFLLMRTDIDPAKKNSGLQFMAGCGTNQPQTEYPHVMIQYGAPTELEAVQGLRGICEAIGVHVDDHTAWECQDMAMSTEPWEPTVVEFEPPEVDEIDKLLEEAQITSDDDLEADQAGSEPENDEVEST